MRRAALVILLSLIVLLSARSIRLSGFHKPAKVTPSVTRHVLDTSILKSGDIILRRGRGVISDMMAVASAHDKRFSHAGILQEVDSAWYVVHMIGGEGVKQDGLRFDRIQDFISDANASDWAVYRLTESDSVRQALQCEIGRLRGTRPSFDSNFNWDTEDSYYCTELVSKVYGKASQGRISLPLTYFQGSNGTFDIFNGFFSMKYSFLLMTLYNKLPQIYRQSTRIKCQI